MGVSKNRGTLLGGRFEGTLYSIWGYKRATPILGNEHVALEGLRV